MMTASQRATVNLERAMLHRVLDTGSIYLSDSAQARADRAKAEARMILSVTEPANYPSSCGPGYWSAFQIGEQYPNTCPVSEYGEALAKALAAFIAEPSK